MEYSSQAKHANVFDTHNLCFRIYPDGSAKYGIFNKGQVVSWLEYNRTYRPDNALFVNSRPLCINDYGSFSADEIEKLSASIKEDFPALNVDDSLITDTCIYKGIRLNETSCQRTRNPFYSILQEARDDLHQAITTGLLFAFMFVIYFLPRIVSVVYKRRQRTLFIFALNLLLGWTLIMWSICLLIAIIPSNRIRRFENES